VVYKVRLALLALLIIVVVLGFASLRHSVHSAKLEFVSITGNTPITVWSYSISSMKGLFRVVESSIYGSHQAYQPASNSLTSNSPAQAQT
jgi:hypothetical protein